MVEKIKTLAQLKRTLQQVPNDILDKYGVGHGDSSFGVITMLENDEDECSEEFNKRWEEEVTKIPAMQEVVNYFNAVIKEYENQESEGDDFVSS